MNEDFAEFTPDQQAVMVAWSFRNWISTIRVGQQVEGALDRGPNFLITSLRSLSRQETIEQHMGNHDRHGSLAASVYSGQTRFGSLDRNKQEEVMAYETAMRLMDRLPEQPVGQAHFDHLDPEEREAVKDFVTGVCEEAGRIGGGPYCGYYRTHEAELISAYSAAIACDPVVVDLLVRRHERGPASGRG